MRKKTKQQRKELKKTSETIGFELATKKLLKQADGGISPSLTDVIEPAHYRKGLDDLYESAYRTRPFNEYRAIMEFVAERYIKRVKENRVEDIDKAIYTLERLKEKEKEREN